MDRIKKIIKSPENVSIIQSMLSKVKQGQFIICRLASNKLSSIHYLTHIPDKNQFIDEKMKECQDPKRILLLIRYGSIGAYILLNPTIEIEEPLPCEDLGSVDKWQIVDQ